MLLALSPLLLPLALHARRRALRLEPAAGPQRGLAGADLTGQPLRLLVLGESTVAGVGAGCQQQALVGQLAQALVERLARPVAWRACGESGITAAQACRRLLPQVVGEPVDLVLLVFGVNDTTQISSRRDWQAALAHLGAALTAQGAQVVFSGVPPLQRFSALPWLLRRLLGMRATCLDADLRRVADLVGAEHHPLNMDFSAAYLALDGYHPSSLGYRVWAQSLAAAISLSPTPTPTPIPTLPSRRPAKP
ncbi:SGNH/GDSL hydrolase family protein [Pseudomonas sp. CrR25]|nr:SGNH/GDSL hydrolase family protein [Pseudomonas sp. CrR25]